MDSKKLKKLLKKAFEVGITKPEPDPLFSGTDIERNLIQYLSAEPSIEKEILEFFKAEPSFDIFNEKMFNEGTHLCRISYKTLLTWLLYFSEVNGIDNALSCLENYLRIDYSPAHAILAISGIEIEKPIDLSPSIQLVPFSSLPSSPLKNTLDPPFFKPENLLRLGLIGFSTAQHFSRPPKSALIRDTRLSPKSFDSEKEMDSFIPNYNDLYEACECLTLVGGSTPLPVASWHQVKEKVPLAGFTGYGYGSSIHDIINPSICKFSEDLSEEARNLYQKFSKLKQQVRDKLRVPILRLNQARRRQNVADKAIDLGVSFEALYLNDRSYKEQIAFTFRLRASWYLGANKAERESLINTFKKIYECRSIAVHTGKLELNKGQEKTSELLKKADDLCVKSIIKITESGDFPKWDKIILG